MTTLSGCTHDGPSDHRYSFGPVPSRRLGRSLGINNIPLKTCSYSCVYCQIGRTTRVCTGRERFYDPQEILREVRDRAAKAKALCERIDYLAFVPDGEPTLDINLGEEIELLESLGLPVAVITNSSLIWRDDVRAELSKADWVCVKVDATSERVWRRINRPAGSLRLRRVLEGIRAFAGSYAGRLVTETMLVGGLNDGERCVQEVAEFLHEVHPDAAYLGIPTRPPAERWVRGVGEERLARIYGIFAGAVEQVEYLIDYEGDDFGYSGDIAGDLLSATAVHPMREDAVEALLSKSGGSWELVRRLVAEQKLATATFNGHLYYLRRPTGKDREVSD